ncbi:MAG TPA: MATE family efflux transporter [Novosphingobium sp.]|nr:MATE family efflux transporter [Novosphingobium sp.]
MSKTRAPISRGDLTQGPILRTLWRFAAPTLAANVVQTLNGSVNSIWVGRLLGEGALAATANANIIMFLAFAAVFGFGMAATVKVGQAFGARDLGAARRAFGSAVGFCGLISLALAALGWVFAPALLRAMATPGESYALALAYLRVIFVAMPASTLSVMLSMGLRGAGDATTPLRFMLVTVALDVVLNPLLISGIGPFPRLGIAGSAIATVIASSLGLAGMIAFTYWRDLPLRLRGAELGYLKPDARELAYILAKGLPMGAQMLIISGAGIVLMGIVNREGLLTTAAYGATLQLWNYLQMPAMAIGAAASAMAAQAIGAGLDERLDRITRAGVMTNLAMTGALIAVLLALDRAALVLFLGPESAAVPLARHIQWLGSWGFLAFGVTFVLFGTMRAGGAVLAPLAILALSMYPVRLGLIALGYPALGADAIWASFPLSSLVSMVLAIVAYRRRGWRAKARAIPSLEAAEESQADGEPAGRMAPSI